MLFKGLQLFPIEETVVLKLVPFIPNILTRTWKIYVEEKSGSMSAKIFEDKLFEEIEITESIFKESDFHGHLHTVFMIVASRSLTIELQ